MGAPGAAIAGGGGSDARRVAVHLARDVGSRPAAGAGELRAVRYLGARFRSAGMRVVTLGFRVPGRGTSHDVVGVYDGPRDCLRIVMAHVDSSPAGAGANDNASGAGVVGALAPRLRAIRPPCDVWLAANGAEERFYTGSADHLGSLELVRRVKHQGRAADLRFALDLDEVGITRRFWLRSPEPRARAGVEGAVLAAASTEGVPMRWVRDSGSGNSDHREFELHGLRAAVIEDWRGEDPCRELACDGWRRLDRLGPAP